MACVVFNFCCERCAALANLIFSAFFFSAVCFFFSLAAAIDAARVASRTSLGCVFFATISSQVAPTIARSTLTILRVFLFAISSAEPFLNRRLEKTVHLIFVGFFFAQKRDSTLPFKRRKD